MPAEHVMNHNLLMDVVLLTCLGSDRRTVQRYTTKVLFSFLFGNRGLGSINAHMRYEPHAYAYADNYAEK